MKVEKTEPGFALFLSATGEALDCLSGKRTVDFRVHGARKALKQARAGLRLMRPALGRAVFDRENRTLRDAAAFLSPVRDAKARLDATARLRAKGRSTKSNRAGLLALRRALKAHLVRMRGQLQDTDAEMRCAALVERSRKRLASRRRPADRDQSIRALERIYRKARKTFAAARAATTAANLHELRKQCKYLHAAAAALRKSGIRRLGGAIARTHDISDWLGDDHDLFALEGEIRKHRLHGNAESPLLARVALLRHGLERKALGRCGKLLLESPSRFAARLT